MSLSISIREALQSDAQQILTIHSACIHEICSDFYTKQQIDTWSSRTSAERFAGHISDEQSVFIVAETSNTKEIVGFAHFGKTKDSRFSSNVDSEVYGFYVSPIHGRKGVGKALMIEVERKTTKLGCSGHIGVVSTLNAVPFYEKCGFAVVKDGTHCISTGGACQDLDCKLLEKTLQL